MSACRRHIDHEALLAMIRHEGPISKTKLVWSFMGYGHSKALMLALREMERKNLITYQTGKAKNGKTAKVYAASDRSAEMQ